MSSGADLYNIDLAKLRSITQQPYVPDVVKPIPGGVKVGHIGHILRVLSAASKERHMPICQTVVVPRSTAYAFIWLAGCTPR